MDDSGTPLLVQMAEALRQDNARLREANAAMLATLKEIQVNYSPFGRPGALIDETIRQAEGRK